jgi:hypothetical protein
MLLIFYSDAFIKITQTYFWGNVQLFTETQLIDLLTVSAQLKKMRRDLAGDFI